MVWKSGARVNDLPGLLNDALIRVSAENDLSNSVESRNGRWNTVINYRTPFLLRRASLRLTHWVSTPIRTHLRVF